MLLFGRILNVCEQTTGGKLDYLSVILDLYPIVYQSSSLFLVVTAGSVPLYVVLGEECRKYPYDHSTFPVHVRCYGRATIQWKVSRLQRLFEVNGRGMQVRLQMFLLIGHDDAV